MEGKKITTLDLTGCKSLGELHQRIRKAFDFPDWYGENWDAFWDLLQTECDADKIKILGEHTLSKEFNWHIEKMHEILQRNKDDHKKYGWNFDFEIIN
ncbi:Barstar (barnase inhibitor) [Caprobacter fermentans]|uniref:Barstar (Barnase inhibitor) n=1 Tax=Caproicibacter fermentans TaxID=2576756 RepID=A0A6N8I3X4_9FIRM|nr:barstar family protein [Caproicibacter fermentans]MVB12732.1 Barstar (barnase inhibitor) [Caproicibacter fermentans]